MSAPGADAMVTLREITAETIDHMLKLSVTEPQQKLVATNAVSIAQAHFNKHAWFRAIYADETPVGFVMLCIDEKKAEYDLWRLMIDQRYQRYGYGRKAVEQVIDDVRQLPNATVMRVSYVPIEGNPSPFYTRLGFVETGEWDDDEKIMQLVL
ncbi:MAG: GNAT family N-acetyltransferase [Chloroflexaceae bacterium]|nr:GNAT family N-acetyltransferase [Chloroflexaceae bacterium]